MYSTGTYGGVRCTRQVSEGVSGVHYSQLYGCPVYSTGNCLLWGRQVYSTVNCGGVRCMGVYYFVEGSFL